MRSRSFFFRLALLGLPLLILLTLGISSAASITISAGEKNIGALSRPITPNDLRPPACAHMNLDSVVTNGDNGNNLIIGSPGNDTIYGRGGDDCIIGGDGNDTIYGDATSLLGLWGTGNDVIIGGGGNDTIYGDGWLGGSGNDTCYGGPGNDTFQNCESANQ